MTKVDPGLHYPIDLNALPPSWRVCYVGDAIPDIQPGFASGVHNQEGKGVPHLRPMNVDRNGRLDLSVVKYVANSDGPRLHGGDVLFNNTNSPELIGKTTSIDSDADLAFSNHMTRLRPPNGVYGRFVAHQLHFVWMSGYFKHRCVKHVNQASIASGTLAKSIPLILPPIDEQNRIVAEIEKQFTRLEAAVAALRRVQAILKRYRAAVLKAACEGKLVPTEAELQKSEVRDQKTKASFETGEALLARILTERRQKWSGKGKYKEPGESDTTDLPRLREGWTWSRLEQLGFTFGGLTKNPKRAKLPSKLPYLRVANVYANELRLQEVEQIGVEDSELKKLLLQPNDILIVEGNGSKDQIGRLAIWDGSIETCVHQNHLIKVRPVDARMAKWILYWLLSPVGRDFVELVASSTSGLYTLSVNKVGDLPIVIPALAEQQRIVAEVERRLSVVDELEAVVNANLQRAARLRQAILQRSFSGNLFDHSETFA